MNFFKGLQGDKKPDPRVSSAMPASDRVSRVPGKPLTSSQMDETKEESTIMPSSQEIDRQLEEMLTLQGQKAEVRKKIHQHDAGAALSPCASGGRSGTN